MNILIAEDNENFGLMLTSYLKLSKYSVTLAKNEQVALKELINEPFDLYIFDVMMPLMDGFELAQKTRELGFKKPIIFLTAKSLKEDKMRGYSVGAIDYLVKPFDPDILLLKIKSITEQFSSSKTSTKLLRFGSFELNIVHRTLVIGESKIKLSPKECELLELLVNSKNELLSREEALLKIWKDDGYFQVQSMNVFITKLRQYLSKDPAFEIKIESIRGSGFILSILPKK
jgi:DNA-binding response OmpR family regulator